MCPFLQRAGITTTAQSVQLPRAVRLYYCIIHKLLSLVESSLQEKNSTRRHGQSTKIDYTAVCALKGPQVRLLGLRRDRPQCQAADSNVDTSVTYDRSPVTLSNQHVVHLRRWLDTYTQVIFSCTDFCVTPTKLYIPLDTRR